MCLSGKVQGLEMILDNIRILKMVEQGAVYLFFECLRFDHTENDTTEAEKANVNSKENR